MTSSTRSNIDPKTGLNILRGIIASDGSQIKVFCPHCKQHHYHGWPSGSVDPGHLEHRQAHCIDTLHSKATDSPFWDRGYLIAVEGMAGGVPTLQFTDEERRASVAGALRIIREIDELIEEVNREAQNESAPGWLKHYIGNRRAQILTAEQHHKRPAA